ncbi:MAG: Dihydrolipoamide dehydrogenase of pyruvate dehydrogenase complex (EC [uncultured Thiotrichaceae bacterium]|uniref:Dihydrolipoyl dehydrogenase n=1 Tax=uncultured Thiotrichaceae bacterium TaxID=298394 RepID=A0A6S6U5Y7_9GAMM|nr:MAG: Dihydrolipoamide dehydrogenase of pyruvate dehydrogenase complex (EC [uncultured Thiotrichaceae bacterium]
MSDLIEVKAPDIGDFSEVEIIEILVNTGDIIKAEDSLITVESDKASMEIPSSASGTVKEIKVNLGDKISEGSVIIMLEESAVTTSTAPEKPEASASSTQKNDATSVATESTGATDKQAQVVVLGSGPGGYTAAFRAADLGLNVILVEKFDVIGGVCLNVGCIPSKALLHTAEVINEAAEFSDHGVTFSQPEIDIDKLRSHKEDVIGKLTGGLKQLAKQRKVEILHGYGTFTSDHSLSIVDNDGSTINLGFEHCIIAAGSRVTKLPFIPWDDPRVMDSTDALELESIPERLLVVGGGIIGLEMATVYDALGSNVTIVELSPDLIAGADRDLIRPLERRIKKKYENIFTNTKVTAITPTEKGLLCDFEGGKKVPDQDTFDKVLVSIGRSPNGKLIDAENAGVAVDDWGFIATDKQMRTNVEHIYAIGDIVGQPMLAHKATHEAKVAAEVIAGHKAYFDARTIPSVAYTDPEVAWMGKTETECKNENIEYEKGAFPWAASGRSLSIGRNEGLTKVLFDKESGKIIGAGIVGTNAGELIAETVLALEMGADAEDIGLTIHPHPTLSETLNFASEVAEGTCTDIYIPKK